MLFEMAHFQFENVQNLKYMILKNSYGEINVADSNIVRFLDLLFVKKPSLIMVCKCVKFCKREIINMKTMPIDVVKFENAGIDKIRAVFTFGMPENLLQPKYEYDKSKWSIFSPM